MNLLFLTHHDNNYGSSKSLINLFMGLKKYDIIPFVVVPRESEFTNELSSQNIRFAIEILPWWVVKTKVSFKEIAKFLIKSSLSAIRLLKLVKSWEIEIIYTNSSVTPMGRLVALLKNLPNIWHIREFGELHFNLQFLLPRWLSLKFIQSSSAIICNSRAIENYYFTNSKNPKVQVIYNGIATHQQFIDYKKTKLNKDKKSNYSFVIIGSITPKKGQESAIRALARLHERGLTPYLIITGDGNRNYVDSLLQLSFKLGVSNFVEFTGFLSDPYEAYYRADCLLMCSEYEAFGRVTAEAMSACLPVIGKNSGGTPEIVVDGETGLLYGSFEELVAAMDKMIKNPGRGADMGLAGWHRAKELFNIEDYAANVYQVIQSVTK